QFNRYEATAAENIAFGDWQEWLTQDQSVEPVARSTGVHAILEAMPQGYRTQLGRLFGEYRPSDGQWQLIGITRALARRNAALLILDEPTAHFDARAEYNLFQRFKE